MRLPVERRRAAPLRGAGIVDPGRLLPPLARRLVVAEELGQFDAERAVRLPVILRCAPLRASKDGRALGIRIGHPSRLAQVRDASASRSSHLGMTTFACGLMPPADWPSRPRAPTSARGEKCKARRR